MRSPLGGWGARPNKEIKPVQYKQTQMAEAKGKLRLSLRSVIFSPPRSELRRTIQGSGPGLPVNPSKGLGVEPNPSFLLLFSSAKGFWLKCMHILEICMHLYLHQAVLSGFFAFVAISS